MGERIDNLNNFISVITSFRYLSLYPLYPLDITITNILSLSPQCLDINSRIRGHEYQDIEFEVSKRSGSCKIGWQRRGGWGKWRIDILPFIRNSLYQLYWFLVILVLMLMIHPKHLYIWFSVVVNLNLNLNLIVYTITAFEFGCLTIKNSSGNSSPEIL